MQRNSILTRSHNIDSCYKHILKTHTIHAEIRPRGRAQEVQRWICCYRSASFLPIFHIIVKFNRIKHIFIALYGDVRTCQQDFIMNFRILALELNFY